MTPHLVRWHDEYADRGLTIIDIDNGQADSLEELGEHVRSEKVPYAVFYDEDGAVCGAYGVTGYPAAYLIDRTGKVVWEGVPSFDPEGAEQQVRKALAASSESEPASSDQR